jgi:hypothetical protein
MHGTDGYAAAERSKSIISGTHRTVSATNELSSKYLSYIQLGLTWAHNIGHFILYCFSINILLGQRAGLSPCLPVQASQC